VISNGTVVSADLGNSSNYSNELHNQFLVILQKIDSWSFEDRSGEGFLTSGAHVRVSRS